MEIRAVQKIKEPFLKKTICGINHWQPPFRKKTENKLPRPAPHPVSLLMSFFEKEISDFRNRRAVPSEILKLVERAFVAPTSPRPASRAKMDVRLREFVNCAEDAAISAVRWRSKVVTPNACSKDFEDAIACKILTPPL